MLIIAAMTLLAVGLKVTGQNPARTTPPPASKAGHSAAAANSASNPARQTAASVALPTFEDVTEKSGINFRHSFGEQKLSSIMEATGSGCAWIDYNNDGLLDLYVVSGRYVDGVTKFSKPDGVEATNHLYRNNGDGTFTDVTEQAGVGGKGFGMGVTVGDYDNDGYMDIFIVTLGGKGILLHARPPAAGVRNHWLTIKLVGTKSNRDGFGARLEAVAGDLHQYIEASAENGYLSQGDPRPHFGLGQHTEVDKLLIH